MRLFPIGLLFLLALTTFACGGATYIPRGAIVPEGAAAEVDDEDIRKAFEARPQLGATFRVAYFSLDPEKGAAIETLLRGVAGVTDVYAIPSRLVTGEGRFAEPNGYGPRTEPREVRVKQLRLLAARAHADVLLVADTGRRVRVEPNGWVATSPLLLPIFFVPFLETTTESFLATYWIDVRNGYLYGQTDSVRLDASDSHTLYSDPSVEALEAQWKALAIETRARLAEVIAAGQRPVAEVARGGEAAGPGLPAAPAPPPLPSPVDAPNR